MARESNIDVFQGDPCCDKRWGAELTADCGKQQMSGPYASPLDHIRCVCYVVDAFIQSPPTIPIRSYHGWSQWKSNPRVQPPGQKYVGAYS